MGFNGIGHFADLFGPSTTTAVEQLFQQQPFQLHQHQHQHQQQRYEECCVPTGDCVVRSSPIRPDDPRAPDLYARVTCSDRGCPAGRYMHRECFDAWERLVLAYMKNAAAAAYSASTVKDPWTAVNVNNNVAVNTMMNQQTAAYEMAYKACGCRCGRGYLKKDPEWPPATSRRRSDDADSGVGSGRATVAASGGKKKKRRPGRPLPPPPAPTTAAVDCTELRLRAGSLSGGSSNGSSSPVTNSTAGSSVSPAHSGGSFGSGSSVAAGSSKRRMAATCPKDVFER